MRFRALAPAAALLIALAAPASADAASYAPGRVIVRYWRTATRAERRAAELHTGTRSPRWLPGGARVLRIANDASVARTVAALEAQPGVRDAHPDYLLHAASAAFYPNDPGRGGPGDWPKLQWNFAGTYGVHAPRAWATMRSLGKAGGRGVVVAVIDTGVAYRNRGEDRRAPDLDAGHFVPGHDFIDHDGYPLDVTGHGTHVTGTIAESVNNGLALTGIAYGVKIMPLRVLDSNENGDASTFARAVRWAADRGADVINMSANFDSDLRARDIPEVIDALRYAHSKGVVMVGASGNDHLNHVDYPARDANVISVGGTTQFGCLARYSSYGDGLDVVAPGGGNDVDTPHSTWDRAHCNSNRAGHAVFQQSFRHDPQQFFLRGLSGTSEAAPHVAAIAALVIASGRLGPHPTPAAVQRRIEHTARDAGASGYDKRYGFGLVDAAAAVAPPATPRAR